MDERYEIYCVADPVFYDSPEHANSDVFVFETGRRPLPDGWTRSNLEDWRVCLPDGVDLPRQGWKIHVSAILDNADEILGTVWDFCVPRRIAFKYLRDRLTLLLRNAKYADRGASGKFVTIYPVDDAQFALVLHELGELLKGRQGPYILSDLRWAEGPMYVRYGGFANQHTVSSSGRVVLGIEDPRTGKLVPDRRDPVFRVPDWVTLPELLAPHLAARNATNLADLPYRFEQALHFSNGGGLYLGRDLRSGEQVVLKEARPFAGLDFHGADAVSRLQREREVLERLAGVDAVPAFRDHFTVADHHFLVEEFIDATPLRREVVRRSPLVDSPEDPEVARAGYTAWVLQVQDRIERAIDAVHERGIVIGDLHPQNILIRPDGRVVLVDFEIAQPIDERRRQPLADPGFLAPNTVTGFDVDRYALACIRLFLFLPITELIALDRGTATQLADAIAETFPVPPEFLREAVRVIEGGSGTPAPRRSAQARSVELTPDRAGWERSRASMAQAILASATPERDDRLFPGDIAQFGTGGGLGLASGAAGVLYALSVTGAGVYPAFEEWLIRRATKPEPGTPLGLYDGLSGVAYALDHLGHRPEALKVLDICVGETRRARGALGLGLTSGLAGIGLTFAHFAVLTGDPGLYGDAVELAELIGQRLGDEAGVPEVSGGEHPYAGLTRGSSGPALLFIRLYEQTGDQPWLDLAATALRQDLRRCLTRSDGSLEVNEGWRTMPYLADGSVGIGLVLADYLRHREDEQFALAAKAIRPAAEGELYVQSGLFYGRAGMILALSRGHAPGTAARDPAVAAQIRRLSWHALRYRGHLAFPGEQLLRLSMDLATGTAGVLLALGAALHDEPVYLPFLAPSAGAGLRPWPREEGGDER